MENEIDYKNINLEDYALFFDKSFNIAVVGLSPNEQRVSHKVAKQLIKKGFKIIPVYPRETEILGKKVYKDLRDIKEKVNLVVIFLRPELAFDIVKTAVDMGIDKVWLQEKVISEESKTYAEKHKVNFVMNRCYLKTFVLYEKTLEQ